MVSAATDFHRHDAAPKPADETRQRLAPQPPPQHNPASRILARQTARVLANVNRIQPVG